MAPDAWLVAIATGLTLVTPAMAASPVPAAAKAVIQQVHAAAARKDLAALEALMISEFTWSFGGDASAKQALAEWGSKPRYLDALSRVTGLACTYEDRIVECPAKARTGFRAGFKQTSSGWRMIYFVEGD